MKKSSQLLLWVLGTLAVAITLAFVFSAALTPQQKTLSGFAATPGGDWPTYMHDAARTGVADGESILSPSNASRLTRLWSFKTGAGIAAQPIIVNGTVYIGSWDGYEYALDAVTGALKWKTYLGITDARCIPEITGVTSSATVQNGVVYVGGGDSYWYALDANTGAVLWKVFTANNNLNVGYYNWASPLIYNGNAYIGLASDCDNPLTQGKLLMVNLATHLVVKTLNIVNNGEEGGTIWSSPAVDAATNTLYLTTGNMTLITQKLAQSMLALDATTLAVKGVWQTPYSQSNEDSDWGGTPILINAPNGRQLVVANNKNGFIYAFDRNNVSAGPIWEDPAYIGGTCPDCGDGSVSPGTYGDGMLFMAGGNTQVGKVGYGGAVRAIDPLTGKYIWQHGTPGFILAALTYANGLLIDGEGPVIEVLNAKTGERLFSYQTGADIYGSASVSHGQIFVGSQDGYVYSFGLASVQAAAADMQCPGSWSCQDVGVPAQSGTETFTNQNQSWTLTSDGTGTANISDQIRYVAQNMHGDAQIVAQVLPQSTTLASTQAGLMVRQSLDRGAPFYDIYMAGNNKVVVQYRTAFQGGLTVIQQQLSATGARYLEIQRVDDVFQAATSSDGIHYTLVPGGTVQLIVPAQVMAGLFAASGVNGKAITEQFAHVALTAPNNTLVAAASTMPCVNGWECQDVGNPLLAGSQTLKNGVWTVNGAGTDLWSEHDQFHFVSQPLAAGNATVSARIISQADTDPEAKAGIIIRSSNAADAAYYAAFLTPLDGLVVQYRSLSGLQPMIITSDSSIRFPVYLKIERWNGIFTTYVSQDGVNWTARTDSIQAMDMQGPAVGGLLVTSHVPTQAASDTFSNVAVSNSAEAAPTACPTNWNCTDVGYPVPAGSQLYNGLNDSWTVEGGGFDIFLNYDQFHYVWQTMNGDGTLSAHVTSQTSGLFNPNAKAGLMIRASSDPAAAYYGIFAKPNNGVQIQWRVQQGGTTGEYNLPLSDQMPIYLRIARAGNTFTAFTSQDGITWTPVSGSTQTLDMNGPLLAGLAVTSHTPATLDVVTFDSVSIQP